MPANAIELEGVVQHYGSERVLDEVDLVAPEGAITVLLGPSGAGKTVTVKHVVGLEEPTRGVVRSTARTSPASRRSSSTRSGAGWAWCSRGRCRSRAASSTR